MRRQNDAMALRVVTLTLGLLLSACGQEAEPGLTGDSQGQPDAIAIELQSGEAEPAGLLSYGDAQQEGLLGTHCWADQCVDFAAPPVPEQFTQIPGDSEIQFLGDGSAETLSVGRPPADPLSPPEDQREIQVKDRRAQLDLEPGTYVLVVFALWDEGDATMTFGLEVTS
jgi:hypothetical protein